MANDPKRRSEKTCFLCCKPLVGKWTAEHFIPHCFYPHKKAPNESDLTLPAHRECNKSTSDDEEWVFRILSLSHPMGLHASPDSAEQERWNRTMRSLKMARPGRPEGHAASFMNRVLEISTDAVALPMGADRFTWVLAKIAKGLSYRECDVLWDGETEWSARVTDYERFIAITEPPLYVEVPSSGDISVRGSVLIAKGYVTTAAAHLLMMLLGQHPVMITTMSREARRTMMERLRPQLGDAVDRIDEHDFMKLKWPKPRASNGNGTEG